LPPHRGLASLSASGKDARQRATVIGLGAVGIVSAIEAVRDGHRVTVIEALGFEREAFGLISDVAEHRRSILANEANRRKPKQSRIQGRTNSFQTDAFCRAE
jgi:glycine/D-amino acid oxidase-like deaminating enzyme